MALHLQMIYWKLENIRNKNMSNILLLVLEIFSDVVIKIFERIYYISICRDGDLIELNSNQYYIFKEFYWKLFLINFEIIDILYIGRIFRRGIIHKKSY